MRAWVYCCFSSQDLHKVPFDGSVKNSQAEKKCIYLLTISVWLGALRRGIVRPRSLFCANQNIPEH